MPARKSLEETANFIPLGKPKGMKPDKPKKERVEGQTPEERKRIARDLRTAARKEKKTAKADAKKLRKLNAIMNRRMTKNSEKYSQNKERNKTRAIDAERTKIRLAAIHQAERLAAKHDPSGKMFNVGEVIALEDGSVKDEDANAIVQGRGAQREAEKAAEEVEAKNATSDTKQEKPNKGPLSNRQKARLEAFAPRPPPPRPVVPEGISLPEGEEDFISMWEITDEEIQKRMSEEKRVKSMARNNLRRRQKEEKRFNQAMKLLKKQTENRGEKWDPEKGRKIILKMHEDEGSEEDSQDFGSDDDSGDEDEDVEEVEQPVEPPKVEKESKKLKKAKNDSRAASNSDAVVELLVPLPEPEPKKEKKSKRPADDAPLDEPKSKKGKKAKSNKKWVEVVEAVETVEVIETLAEAEAETPLTKKEEKKKLANEEYSKLEPEEKLAKKEAKRIKKEEKTAKEAKKLKKQAKREKESGHYVLGQPSPKKRKHEDNETEEPVMEKLSKKHRFHEEAVNGSGAATQWNPDALTGDASRHEKFLRLLGAKKTNAAATDGAKHKSTAKVADISKVQTELERQYEAGMKMKHDGGGKRRGLGA